MLKFISWIIRTSLFIVFILILGSTIEIKDKTISAHVRHYVLMIEGKSQETLTKTKKISKDLIHSSADAVDSSQEVMEQAKKLHSITPQDRKHLRALIEKQQQD